MQAWKGSSSSSGWKPNRNPWESESSLLLPPFLLLPSKSSAKLTEDSQLPQLIIDLLSDILNLINTKLALTP